MNQAEIREAIRRARSVLMRTKDGVFEQDDGTKFRRSFDELADGLPGFPVFNTELRYFRGLMKNSTLLDQPPTLVTNWQELVTEAESLMRRIDTGNMF